MFCEPQIIRAYERTKRRGICHNEREAIYRCFANHKKYVLMAMGNAQSDSNANVTMKEQRDKVFTILKDFQAMEPPEVYARCGPETKSLVQDEVKLYISFSNFIDKHRENVAKDRAYYSMKENGVKQLLELKKLYKDALVHFLIATETGLTLFPIISNNLIDTTEIIGLHIGKINQTMQLLISTLKDGVNQVSGENRSVFDTLQKRVSDLTDLSENIKSGVNASASELQNTIDHASS